MNTKNTEKQPKNKQQSSNRGKVLEPADYEKLRGIVIGLNPQDEAHWNKSGGPDMNYIKEAMGMVITADHMKASGVGGWNREGSAERATAKKLGGVPGGVIGAGAGAGTVIHDPVEIGSPEHQEIVEEFPAPETSLEREDRERQEAKAMQRDNDQEKANKHDESAAKIRAQIAAQKKAEAKYEKDQTAKKKQQDADDVEADIERKERIALEQSVHGQIDMSKGPGPDDTDPMQRVDRLERAVLTISKVLLDTPMTPVQRGKIANCVALLDPPSDED